MAKPSDCIVAHYKMDEASGSALDSVGSLNLAEAAGGNSIGTAAGKVATCRYFNDVGTNGHFTVAASAVTAMANTYNWGFTCWAKIESKAGVNGHLISRRNVNLDYWLRYVFASDRFEFSVWTTGGVQTAILANNLGIPALATWYFIACWYDSVAQTINISVNNGTVNSTAHGGNINATSTAFEIGAYGAGGVPGEQLDGWMDEVSVYKNGFPSEYLSNIYNAGNGVNLTSLLAIGAAAGGDDESYASLQAAPRSIGGFYDGQKPFGA